MPDTLNPLQSSRRCLVCLYCVVNGKSKTHSLGLACVWPVYGDKAFFPPGHFQLLCVSSGDMCISLNKTELSYLFVCRRGSESSLVDCGFPELPLFSRNTQEITSVEYPLSVARISWFQFAIKPVILTLISLLHILSFSTCMMAVVIPTKHWHITHVRCEVNHQHWAQDIISDCSHLW